MPAPREATAPVHVPEDHSAAVGLSSRVDKVEWQQTQTDGRLKEGAESFSGVRKSIEDIRDQLKPKPVQLWKIVSIAITLALIIGAWVWAAAKYPDRDEFNHARQVGESKVDAVKTQVNYLKIEQVKMQSNISLIKASQARTEKDLDEIKKDLKALSKRRR